jgi:hypothetical protein
MQAAVHAWGESNEAVAHAVGRGVAEGEAAQKGLDAGTAATAERQATPTVFALTDPSPNLCSP